MFTVHCPRHGQAVLLNEDHIEALDNTDDGIEVRWLCYCGERGAFLTSRPGNRHRAAVA
jgi:hypothetical protein